MTSGKECSIPGCGKPHYARGWCPAHYSRWRKHGDPHTGASTGRPRQHEGCGVADCDRPHYS